MAPINPNARLVAPLPTGGALRRLLPVMLFLLIWFPVQSSLAADLVWEKISGGRRARVYPPPAARIGFTQMTNDALGLHFTNRLRERLLLENNNFMQGSGVALGDFDGDGWCDLYFCAIDGANALYRNLGNWRFQDVTAQAGVAGSGWPSTGAVFADLDGDGRLDLLVNTLGQGTHVFFNQGAGRFQERTESAGLKSATGSTGLALGDVDGDGDLDLYVANYGTMAILRAGGKAELKQVNGQWQVTGPYADRLRYVDGHLEEVGEPDVLYRNDGRGRFTPVPWNSSWFLDYDGQPLPTPWDFGLGAQIRDLNGDGFPDIYVCNDFQTVDRIWINDGTGHFRLLPRLALRHQSFASMGVDFADFDRDGHLDFFVVEMFSRDPGRRLRQLSGMALSMNLPGRFENRPEVTRNTLFRNRGDGTYAEIAAFAGVEASDWSWQPAFLDVDLDGYEDLLVANGNAYDTQDRDALQKVRSLGRQTPEQTRTNLLLYPRLLTPNVAFHNRGDSTFAEVGRSWGFDSAQISHGLALADLDHDGDLDVVANCLYAPPLLYRNDAAAPRVAVRLRGLAGNIQGLGARVELLGGAVPHQFQEIVGGGRYLAGDDPVRVFASGLATNGLRLEVRWRSGRRSLVEEVLPNYFYELDEPAAGEVVRPTPPPLQPSLFSDQSERLGHTHHEEPFAEFAAQPLLWRQLGQLGPGVAWFDLDGDGHEELFIGAGRGGRLACYRGDGRGGLSQVEPASPVALPEDAAGLAGFVAADGQRLLLTGLASYENPASRLAVGAALWSGSTNRFTHGPLRDVPIAESSTGPLAVADLDADQDLDLFVGGRVISGRYPQAASSRIFLQTQGRLRLDETNQAVLRDVGLVSGAVWSDLTGDGFPELVLACEWGPLKVFRNHQGRLEPWVAPVSVATPPPSWSRLARAGLTVNSLADLVGWWNSVTAADVDGDGRLDLIAGNWGLNTSYASGSSPAPRLYFGDLAGRGVVDLLEAVSNPEKGAIVPIRSLATLSQAAPSLGLAYPSHQAYSQTTVGEILQHLQALPQEVAAPFLESAVLLNRGEHFELRILPPEAQWAPVFGCVADDLDGDGTVDLFLAQNFFGLRPELPRLDAGRGLLLLGRGTGEFSPMPAAASGLAIYGEQRGAAVGDFDEDGRLDLVVAQSGAATRLFRNQKAPSGLRLRLVGPVGNPQAVGAVVRCGSPLNLGPAREIQVGSGYWSQNSSTLILPRVPGAVLKVRWPGGAVTETLLPNQGDACSVDTQGRVHPHR